ncbi:MAG TPA: hypothetical protein VFV93_04275 [Thermomicrobiales bacterium]|nr:hypothetical protein [Thermomicrobiales bacterium]
MRRVVPVAQQQVVDDVSLLIYSLEFYETGFVAVVRLSWIGDHGGLPSIRWTAQDDRGTTFPYADMAGSGGGRHPDRFSWRIGCMFGAPVPEAATRLDLTATAVGFLTFAGQDDGGRPRVERSQTIAGPWHFTIPLPTSQTGE